MYTLTTGNRLFSLGFMLTSDCQLKPSDEDMECRINEASCIIEANLGNEVQDLFIRMMALKSRDRITPKQALQHPYIKVAEQACCQPEMRPEQGEPASAVVTGKLVSGRSPVNSEYILSSEFLVKGARR